VHFNAKNQLTAINGVFVPEIAVDATPKLTSAEANAIAVNAVGPTGISARKTTLYVYHSGLARGVVGSSYLVYEVEATNGVTVRDFVYVEAHTGKIVDRVSALDNALTRRVYSGTYTTTAIVWQEGDPFPFTGVYSTDINSIISTTGETYNLFMSAFGRDSYNALGHVMETVNNDPRINCPNANWNGITTNYCTDVTGDDTVAHEWGHAYTEYTHNLIYAWQPGALNESYSDIWGEVVDLLNGRGKDVPGGLRTDGLCSIFTSPTTVLQINSPAAIAGNYPAASSSFGPSLISSTNWVTSVIVLVNDGVGRDGSLTPPVDSTDATTSDGCSPFVNAAQVSGTIALIDRGTCTFQTKVDNANAAHAAGIIVANYQAGGNGLIDMTGTGGTAPAIFVGYNTGLTIRSQLTNTVNATLKSTTGGLTDNSYRWLSGEDDPAFGGAIRDMWSPNCYTDPARVADAYYQCDATDGGGVHTNSGVPNHGFALLVDGGSFNGYTITGISMTKAAHLYYRAQSVYQVPTTDFADHADALLASCNDLVAAGTNLPALSVFVTNTVLSGQVFTTTDCLQVTKMISATEMRVDPAAQCNFQPLLNPNAPALCAAGTGSPITVFTDTFEGASGWTVSHTDVYSPTNFDWTRVISLPSGRPGTAFFAIDSEAGSCSQGPGDVSRVQYLASPVITLPLTTTVSRLAFDQWVATEMNADGGNLQISVNSGPWQLVNGADFTFNPYNTNFETAANGNTNPLAGQPAFSGTDGGVVSGSWVRSMVKISSYATKGDRIQFRYQMGTDGCGGVIGWYVDDVQVYYCSADQDAQIAIAPTSLSSTQKPNTSVNKTLTISNTGTTDLNWTLDESPVLKPSSSSAPVSEAERLAVRKPGAKLMSTLRPETIDVTLANVVQDGGFEATSASTFQNPYWSAFSQGFGTPFCTQAACGGGPVPHGGIWHVRFGGAGPNTAEQAYVSQAITIPHGGATLNFYLLLGATVTGTGQMSVTIDGQQLFQVTQANTSTYGSYTQVSLNVSQFADGGSHVLRFGEADAANDGNFNAFVDNVSVDTAPCYIGGSLPWLSTSPVSGTNASGTNTPVSANFNSTGLAPGVYTGTLCIASNAVNSPVVNVPVSMTVEPYKIYLPLIRK